ncbi:T9SS type A sorting domain-containing protein [uncultured Algibacter sp.]|uniref:T9SS type A sorting domain-containing protein n=1 Tax=uncultured Algibacter sp. TaxID=298659 RepID=UPI002605ED70|nr:T9SS type A sorting domain-containing protein [uncultured Algibacter sp.]
MKQLLILIVCPFFVFGQTQIGQDIDGKYSRVRNRLGTAVKLSQDGSVMAISARENTSVKYRSGQVTLFRNNSGVWTQIGKDIDGEGIDDQSGYGLDLSSDGSIVAIGAPFNNGNGNNSGHVRVYKNENDVWTQIGEDIDGEAEGDNSGYSVSLSSDGSIVAIGARYNDGNGDASGHIRIYKNNNGVWMQIGEDIDGEAEGDNSGYSVSLSSNGSIVAIGARYNDGNGSNSGHVRIYKNENGVWMQIGEDIDGEAADDRSGYSVELSSDGTIVGIGAYWNDGNGSNSGHVRIYKNKNEVWTQIGEDIDGEASDDQSGYSLGLSSDGSIVAIGANKNDGNGVNSGHVRIYKNENEVWTQIGEDIDGEDIFDESGTSLGLSSDGSTIAVGAPKNHESGSSLGHVRAYNFENNLWTQIGSDIYGDWYVYESKLGSSCSLSNDGTILAIGAENENRNQGTVYVYKQEGSVWTQIGQGIAGEEVFDTSGRSVSLSSDGSIVAIGAVGNDGNGQNSGHVRIYKNENGVWTQIGEDIDGKGEVDRSGWSVSLSSDGSIVAIGAPFNDRNGNGSGYVSIYKNENGVWTQIGEDINGKGEVDRSGWSVSLSSDGSIVAIGAPYNNINGNGSGYVRVYKNNNGVWTQIGEDINGEAVDDRSGYSVSLSSDGSIVAIGARYNDGNGSNSGHVRIYKNENEVWTQIGEDIDGEAEGDFSGSGVELSSDGSIVAIGAVGNDGNGSNSGHVRIYKNKNDVWTQIGKDIDGEALEYIDGEAVYNPSVNGLTLFGKSISLSSDGNIVAIGALQNNANGPFSGSVRVYDLNAVLSIQSFEKDYFSYYPNPVNDVLNINLNKGLELKQINIYNLQSQYLYSVKSSKIDVSNLLSGMYFIEVETNQGKSAKKIVVQ